MTSIITLPPLHLLPTFPSSRYPLPFVTSLSPPLPGASSGIGRVTAAHFARLGASVTLSGRNGEELAKSVDLCISQTGGALAKVCEQLEELEYRCLKFLFT